MNIILHKQLSLLVQLAKKDGLFHEAERKMITDFAKRHNIDNKELEEVIQLPENQTTSLGALSPERKADYLKSFIELMMADGEAVKSELLFCTELAIKMGFKKEVVEAAVYFIENSDDHDENELLQLIRRYLF